MHELICSSRLVKPTYVLEESSGFVVPVVTVTLDSGSVFAPGGGKETCVVGLWVAAQIKKQRQKQVSCH